MTVVFSGENPGLTLYKAGSDQRVAAVSYWRCVISEHGEGNALVIWVDPDSVPGGTAAPHAIYTDNPAVAQLVTDRFTRHFDGFKELGFESMQPEQARFFQESDSRWYHRVVCNTGAEVIELVWWDVLDYQPVHRPSFELGGATWELMTVICPCESAEIRIANVPVEGEVRTRTNENGSRGSSCFMAFSETWIAPN